MVWSACAVISFLVITLNSQSINMEHTCVMMCVPYIISRCPPDKTVPVHFRFTLSRPQSCVIWKLAGSASVREGRAGRVGEIEQPGCKSVFHAASKMADATTACSSKLICGFSFFTIPVFDYYSYDLNGLMYFLPINFWHEHASRFFCLFQPSWSWEKLCNSCNSCFDVSLIF